MIRYNRVEREKKSKGGGGNLKMFIKNRHDLYILNYFFFSFLDKISFKNTV